MASRLLEWLDPFWKTMGVAAPANYSRYCNDWDGAQARFPVSFENEADCEQEDEVWRLVNDGQDSGFPLLVALADRGSVASMERVAWCYGRGTCVARDPIEAEIWRQRAFLCGSDYGLLTYGATLARRGDYKGAEAVYRVGAERDWAPALDWLVHCRLRQSLSWKTLREVRAYLERAAEQGSPRAKGRLGLLKMFGAYGLREFPRGRRLMQEYIDFGRACYRAEHQRRATGGPAPGSPPPNPVLH